MARSRGEQFLRVGQSLLENSARFSLGPNCRIVLARSFDALDVICFRWHCWLLDVIALTIVDEGGPMFAGADEVAMQLLHLQVMLFDKAESRLADGLNGDYRACPFSSSSPGRRV